MTNTMSQATPTLYREFTQQAQIDAQYNTSLTLPDPAAPGRHFVEQAQHARATLRCSARCVTYLGK